MEWVEGNRVKIDPPKKPKKLTGTRFATILGLNPWSTPFEVWCEVTRTYQKPFEDTIYTIAGKTIEPKQAAYMKSAYFMRNLVRPSDLWGEDYFTKTFGDFFPEDKVLGGMWDYLLKGADGEYSAVLEMKTTKRVEDWSDNVPEYYALQAALYAYLLGVDDVYMVSSFLEEADYQHPENFTPAAKNTIVVPFKLSERYPNFERDYVNPALRWWEKYVESGESPEYDEKKDAEILKALRTATVDMGHDDLPDLIREAEDLKRELDDAKAALADKEKRYKAITDGFKKEAIANFADGTKSVDIVGSAYKFSVSKSESLELDTDAMKADGIYDKYLTKPKVTYTLRVSAVKKG